MNIVSAEGRAVNRAGIVNYVSLQKTLKLKGQTQSVKVLHRQ